jgi:hypothetical protein
MITLRTIAVTQNIADVLPFKYICGCDYLLVFHSVTPSRPDPEAHNSFTIGGAVSGHASHDSNPGLSLFIQENVGVFPAPTHHRQNIQLRGRGHNDLVTLHVN